MDAISIDKLSKTYKSGKVALNELSLNVKTGEVFSLLGANGAGKSTLINILTTYLQATSGKVLVMGKDLCMEQNYARSQIACVAQQTSIDNHLSLHENMLFQSRLYKIDSSIAKTRVTTLIESFQLMEYTKHRIATYSGGIKRRLDIAMSMMSNPKILFLDEPTVGMDIDSRQATWEVLKKVKKDFGTTIFLTTHYLEEADMLSDTICIIKDGHEIVQDTPQNLRRYTKQNLIKLVVCNPQNTREAMEVLGKLPFIQSVRCDEKVIYANVNDSNEDFLKLNQYAMDKKLQFNSVMVVEPSLDDIFLAITHGKEGSI